VLAASDAAVDTTIENESTDSTVNQRKRRFGYSSNPTSGQPIIAQARRLPGRALDELCAS